MSEQNIIGVILAGGYSSRMGSNKSLLEIDGVTMIKRTHDLLKQIFNKVIISTNEPDLFKFIDAKKIKDSFSNLGPLAGIHASLSSVESQKIFLLSCDMPFMQPSIINHLLKINTEEMIVVPKIKDRVQYLCGIYDKQTKTKGDKKSCKRNQH